ncbi:MAG TPA: alpha-L-arabinofuranosidase C-terminal domain-containing protein [Chloroflexota bacterium]
MAEVQVDPARQIGTVDRRIFGGFVEHLGRCIYGGIFDEGSPLADEHGFRRDVLEAAGALRMPLLRWPGGNFVSGYHWTDGIGPRSVRPRKTELAWFSEEPNRFGTDEFIQYCRALGTEPYICVNMGTGTLDEAQAWVEYCNGSGDTHWANLRRQNGHPEPYRVRYWGLGNEMYGRWQIGALPAEEYVRKAREFAKVMKWTDSSIELVSCGELGWTDWDRTVIDGLAAQVEYHSVHVYTGSPDYYANVFAPAYSERALRVCEAYIEKTRYAQKLARPLGIAYDEWNVWYRQRGRDSGLEERYDLADALAVASFLNVFVRHCRSVKIANLAQLVNVIAPIFTSPEGLFLQTIYHPLRLYAEHLQEVALDLRVECQTRVLSPEEELQGRSAVHKVADLGPFPYLDASATRDASGQRFTIGVVNRHRDEPIEATLRFADLPGALRGRAYVVNGRDPTTVNSFEQPDAVAVAESPVAASGGELRFSFPAHSATVLVLAT